MQLSQHMIKPSDNQTNVKFSGKIREVLLTWKSNLNSLFTEQESNSAKEREILKLSAKDSKLLVDALKNPPKPSEALLSVFK